MINLGEFVVNTSIKISFDIADFTSWYTDKFDVYYPGIAMKLITSSTRTECATYWLIEETDPYIIRQLDQMDIKTIESSW